MKSTINLFIIGLFVGGATSLPLFAEGPAAPPSQEAQYREVAQQIKLFGDIYKEVNRRYVDEITQKDFIKAGIDGMLETLDPYTVYFEPDNTEQLEEITKGKYGGIGIEIGIRGKNRELTVISPIEDTPAARKGIRSGDVIIAVGGKSTAGFTTQDATKLIRGEAGTDVTITIKRPGFDKPLDYTLNREQIRIHDVAYSGMIDKDIGYIKLAHFSSLAGEELDSALVQILANKPKGMILDLRSNPGGLLPAAIAVAQQFLKPGETVVSTKGRAQGSDRSFQARGVPRAPEIPLVVLVNGGSASASEIVAGALQDLDRAVIIGTQSFGKGLVQSVVDLSDGAVLKITTARYYTPSGRLIQRDRPKTNDFFGPDDEDPELVSEDGEMVLKDKTTPIDTTVTNFVTRSGRKVFGGGGISPDILVEQPLLQPIEVEMFRRDLFFSFMADWLTDHGRPDTTVVNGEMLAKFDVFLDSSKFEAPIPGADHLRSLRQLGEQDSLSQTFFTQLDALQKTLAQQADLKSPELREFVRQSLDREMSSALGGREWRTRSTFDEDVQLQEAVRVLRDKSSYAGLLEPEAATDKKKN